MFPGYLAAPTIVLLMSVVIVRVRMLKQRGIVAMKFATLDKTDFLIPPFCDCVLLSHIRRRVRLADLRG